ncbi:50S ribosomal protein L29 [Myxococcota bacterium]
MKAKDLRERSTDDLLELSRSLRRELFSFRMKNATGRLDDTSLLRKTRKDIARIELVLTERVRAGAQADGGSQS